MTQETPTLRMVSWNVNGLRSVCKKGFAQLLQEFDADVVAIQETKLQDGDLAKLELDTPGYHRFFSHAERKGYSGTAVFSRTEPLSVLHGFFVDPDDEGRVCALEFDRFWFVNTYVPNAQDGLARIDYRMAFDDALRGFLKELEHTKPVVLCGDLNVAHNEIDLKNPGPNRGNAGFSDEERGKFTELLDAGFVDTFRMLHPDQAGAYSWWSYRFKAREKNAGWRIDYFVVSEELAGRVACADILSDVYGSDHCPVRLELTL